MSEEGEVLALPAPLSAAQAGKVVHRDTRGRVLPGSQLNPNPGGLPRRKAQIIALKENLELAVRGPSGPLNAQRVCEIVRKMCQLAMAGDVRAARLVLGLAVSPAGAAETKTDGNSPPVITIRIENMTDGNAKAQLLPPPIDGEFTETSNG